MDECFPGATEAILRSVSNLESARAIFNEAIEEKRRQYFRGNIIEVGVLAQTESEAPTVLFEFLRPLNFTYTQVCDILASVSGSGATFRSTDGKVIAELSHGCLEINDAAVCGLAGEECHTVSLQHSITEPLRINISRHNASDFHIENLGADAAYIDADAVTDGALWQFRHWHRGDRITPFGSHKSKLVSDLFAAARYSASQKRQAWILTRNDEIIWIPGLRNSALWTVGSGTHVYLRLRLIKN